MCVRERRKAEQVWEESVGGAEQGGRMWCVYRTAIAQTDIACIKFSWHLKLHSVLKSSNFKIQNTVILHINVRYWLLRFSISCRREWNTESIETVTAAAYGVRGLTGMPTFIWYVCMFINVSKVSHLKRYFKLKNYIDYNIFISENDKT